MIQGKGGEDLSGGAVIGTEKSADACLGGHVVRTWSLTGFGC